MDGIFEQWPSMSAALFGHQPICLEHRLAKHPLFSRDALAELIERYPEDQHLLVHMGPQGSPKKLWRNGKIGRMSGHAVIDAIEHGRLWLNLLRVHAVDPRYRALLEEIYDEIHTQVPTYPRTFKHIAGLLISSPRAQVYYHFDSQLNNLWQIAGSKRVYVYPATPPFVTNEMVERVTLLHNETAITYQPWFDDYASVFELQPGQMLQWALNAPHRIENGDELSISLTTEFQTYEARRHMLAMCGNALLRQAGLEPRHALAGPAFHLKAALFMAISKAGFLKAKQAQATTFYLSQGLPADGMAA